jgi:hypothetical protein
MPWKWCIVALFALRISVMVKAALDIAKNVEPFTIHKVLLL